MLRGHWQANYVDRDSKSRSRDGATGTGGTLAVLVTTREHTGILRLPGDVTATGRRQCPSRQCTALLTTVL